MSKMNKKGLIPMLRFPEFRGASEWKRLNGNKVFQQVSNKNHNSDLPILAITQEYGAIPRDLIDYSVSATEKSIKSYKVVEIGDFIISLRSFQGGIEYSNYKGICSPAYVILRKKIDLNECFFKQYFKTAAFIRDLTKNLEGLRDGKMISYNQFSDVPLSLPHLEEQQKIADCLFSLDELITVYTQKYKALQSYKKGLMQNLFPAESETVPALRFPEFEGAGEWRKGSVDNLATLIMGYAFKSTDFVKNGIQLIRMSNLYQSVLKFSRSPVFLPKHYEEKYSRFVIRPLDLLMSMTGTAGKEDYGFVVQVPSDSPNLLLNQRVVKILPKKGCVESFLLQLLKSESFLKKLYELPGGTKQANLSAQQLKELDVLFPEPREQQKIADCLSSVDDLITAQAKKIEELKAHKKGLMQQLFPSFDEVRA
jgi:type I restriction enzyme S subunit